MSSLPQILTDISQCTLCQAVLPAGPRPVLQVSSQARILIASQAPGRKVHASGVPFSDASGDRLRSWLGIDSNTFYDAQHIAIVPMGFCYPGTGKHGDFPPRPECAAAWRKTLLQQMPSVQLTLLIGQYAQHYHLPTERTSVTELVARWQEFWPAIVPLPHPSPRNNIWLSKNPWFEHQLLPALKQRVANVLATI